MSCENERPCRRCIQRGIGDQCTDNITDRKRGRKAMYLNDSSDDSPKLNSSVSDQTKISTLPNLKNCFSTELELSTTCGFTSLVDNESDLHQELDFPKDLQFLFSDFFPIDPINTFNKNVGSGEEEFENLLNAIKKELADSTEEEKTFLLNAIVRMRDHIVTHLGSQSNPHYWDMDYWKSDIIDVVEEHKRMFEKNGTPTIIWDRTGTVHYINEQYRKLTNWSLSIPSVRGESPFHKEMNPKGFKSMVISTIAFLMSTNPNKSEPQAYTCYTINTGVRIHPSEKYLEGTMSITLKLDPWNFPLVYIGNFLPSIVPNPTFRI